MAATSDSNSFGISPARAWWTVVVLFVAYTFSYIDRSILALLVGPLKRDLHLTDTEIGMVSGIAFAIFYAAVALPLSWLADRKSRRMIIMWGVTIWSFATAACGLAGNFWHLFLARMGVGAGEAVLQPSAFSLIADLFPKEQRGFAYGLFGSGTFVGAGIALIMGGAVIQWVEGLGALPAPFQSLHAWQLVFIAVGLPGLLVLFLLMTIVEPRHRLENKPVPAAPGAYPKFLRANALLLACLFVGWACGGVLGTATQAWVPSFFIRHFHLTAAVTGYRLGLTSLIVAPIGAIFMGFVLRYFTRKGYDDAPLRTNIIGTFFVAVGMTLTPLMPNWELSLLCYAVGLFFSPWPYVSGAASLQLITPVNMRAQIAALYAFIVTIIAIMGGPMMVGLFTDYLFKDELAVGKSIALTCVIAGLGMAVLTMIMFRRFREAVHAQDARAALST